MLKKRLEVARPSEEERREALHWILSRDMGHVGSPEEIKEGILKAIDEGIKKSLETD